MSLLPEIEDLELRPNESVIAEWLGKHEQRHLLVSRILKPGKVVLTNQRLAFQPQKMGLAIHALGVIAGTPVAVGDPWSTELSDIAQVIDKGVSKIGVEGRILVVERRSGLDPETLFVTTSFDETAEKITGSYHAPFPLVQPPTLGVPNVFGGAWDDDGPPHTGALRWACSEPQNGVDLSASIDVDPTGTRSWPASSPRASWWAALRC